MSGKDKESFKSGEQSKITKDNQSYIEIANLTETSLDITNLEINTGYYIKVTALNEIGEGYKGEAIFIKTLAKSVEDL